MSENIPNPPAGALPPKPAEAAKVQPKKETVRINLPPKPTAAPTIKIPAPSAVAAATPAPAAPVAAALATSAAPPTPSAAHSPAQRLGAAAAPRQAPSSRSTAPGASGVKGIDKGLAVVAMLVALGVAGHVAWLSFK